MSVVILSNVAMIVFKDWWISKIQTTAESLKKKQKTTFYKKKKKRIFSKSVKKQSNNLIKIKMTTLTELNSSFLPTFEATERLWEVRN